VNCKAALSLYHSLFKKMIPSWVSLPPHPISIEALRPQPARNQGLLADWETKWSICILGRQNHLLWKNLHSWLWHFPGQKGRDCSHLSWPSVEIKRKDRNYNQKIQNWVKVLNKISLLGWAPLILVTQEADIRRITVRSQPRQIVPWDPILKKPFTKKG
jgi:hypothetical protein